MNSALRSRFHSHALTVFEVVVAIALIVFLAAVFFPCTCGGYISHAKTRQLSNGKIIFIAMVNYAGTDDYPLYRDRKDLSSKFTDSNEAFETLLGGGYLDDKKILFQNGSAWCRKAANTEATAKQVLPGENDWCYVAGLNRTTARSNWPILANAFVPGTTHYVADVGKKGGVWKGAKAVVVYCGGNAEIEDTLDKGGSYIVRRKDQVQEDAFVPTADWLTGSNVKVLYPKGD